MVLTCERGEYLSTHGSFWSFWVDAFSRDDVCGCELSTSPFLFLGFLGSAFEQDPQLPFLLPDTETLSPGKSLKDGSTQRFSYYTHGKTEAIKDEYKIHKEG